MVGPTQPSCMQSNPTCKSMLSKRDASATSMEVDSILAPNMQRRLFGKFCAWMVLLSVFSGYVPSNGNNIADSLTLDSVVLALFIDFSVPPRHFVKHHAFLCPV